MKVHLAWLACLACGCAAGHGASGSRSASSAGTLDGRTAPVHAIASSLVAMAELRVDLSALRVDVRPIEPDRVEAPAVGASASPDVARAVAAALQAELAIALSAHTSVIDAELAAPRDDAPGKGAGPDRPTPAHAAATHVVVGDFVERDGALLVTVRLVEVESLLIVASARGEVELDGLVDARRFATSDDSGDGRPSRTAAPSVALFPGAGSTGSTGASGSTGATGAEAPPAPAEVALAARPSSADPAPGAASARSFAPGARASRPLSARDLEGIGEPATAAPRRRRPAKASPPADPAAATASAEAVEHERLVQEARRLVDLPATGSAQGPAAHRLRAAGRPIRKEPAEKPAGEPEGD